MERKLEGMTAACDAARRCGLRDKEALAESRNQSSELQEEMRSDVEAITLSLQETKEEVANLKTRLASSKEAATANKARSDRQVAQLVGEKDAAAVEVKEFRVESAELNDALGLSHAEEARLSALGVELQEQLAALTVEKEQSVVSWARERRDRDAIIGAMELQNASKTTELDEAKAELNCLRSELRTQQPGQAPGKPVRVPKCISHMGTRR